MEELLQDKLHTQHKKIEAYYIVVGLRPSRKPFKHNSRKEALVEANRLAEKYPDKLFTIMCAVQSLVVLNGVRQVRHHKKAIR